jgi:hypothetical protein
MTALAIDLGVRSITITRDFTILAGVGTDAGDLLGDATDGMAFAASDDSLSFS